MLSDMRMAPHVLGGWYCNYNSEQAYLESSILGIVLRFIFQTDLQLDQANTRDQHPLSKEPTARFLESKGPASKDIVLLLDRPLKGIIASSTLSRQWGW